MPLSSSPLIPFVWSTATPSTTLGTSTTLTTINGGNVLQTPQPAGTIMEVMPVQTLVTATAGETLISQFSATSQSIGSLQPKAITLTPMVGGLGTEVNNLVPISRTWKWNTRLPFSSVPITLQGQALNANTAAPRMGCTVWWADTQPQRGEYEQFYDSPSTLTSTGTAAATVVQSSLTENGGTILDTIYSQVAMLVNTNSNPLIGSLSVTSTDIGPIQTLSYNFQPVATGLAATTTGLQADQNFGKETIRMNSTATLAASITYDVALTSAGKSTWGISFRRSPMN